MASGQLPIRLIGVADLPSLGLNSTSFRFGWLTLESEKYICIREEAQDGSAQVVVVELQNNNNVVRRPMKAEAAIMNPAQNVIALKAKSEGAGHFVQVYNLDTKVKMKMNDFPESIVYWRWMSPSKLAVVTSRSVYHWSMEGTEAPRKMFDRAGALADQGAQIINYATDSTERWCLLVAISTPDQGKTINGNMQLYFTELQQQQMLEGHAGCFGEIPLYDGAGPVTCFCFAEKKLGEQISRVHIMEINKPAGGSTKFKATKEISYPPDAQNDFPVAMHLLSKYGVVTLVTKLGFLYLFETTGGNIIYRTKISDDPVFVTCRSSRQDGVLGVNRRGQVIGIAIDEQNLIPFIVNACRHIPDAVAVSFSMAQRFRLQGAEDMFATQFNRLLAGGDVRGAARVAAGAPGTLLRNQETIQKLKMLPVQPGQPHPMQLYFSTLLELGKLNKIETLELAGPVLQQGRKQLIESWIREDKIECSEELGDLVRPYDPQLALSIDMKTSNPQKVLVGLVAAGQYDKIAGFCQQNNVTPDYMNMIRSTAASNPDAAVTLAKQAGTRIDINQVVDIFLGFNNLQAATAYLLDVLKEDRADQGHLQTKLLEMNILAAPQVAETIFQTDMFSHYDKVRIAQLCEKAGLFQRALENYREINDIRRVILNGPAINPEFLIAFFGHMTPNNALQCLYDLLKANRQANLQIAVQTAIKYHEQLTLTALIQMFEQFGSFDGLFYFLGSVLTVTEDPEVHFKYIEAAAKLNQTKEVERVIRETKCYDPVRVKDFLKDIRLPDPRPLIYLCDIHGFGEELTRYLYKNNQQKYIEVYLMRVNPEAAPVVLGTLVDLDCDENYLKQVLNSMRASCPVEPLVEEMEKRNKLKLVQGWLEDRGREGSQNTALHTALAKIYVDINKDPETFLLNNRFYDSKIVGKYCEDRDPHLAVTAYKRAWGECDDELIEVTNKNALYRIQARYLVERQSLDLWAKALDGDNKHRRPVIDQVVASALPDSKNPEEVSCTVKAFIKAELPNELIELLEKIVLHNSDFSNNRNLQNLLILTAIKSDQSRVIDYINRLDNYDAPELAKIALGQYNLYEEAFLIYRKAGMNEEAVEVLISHVENLDRAKEFAEKIASPDVWSRLGKAMLDNGLVADAISSYIKAQDTGNYVQVIASAEKEGLFEKLIPFLLLARKQQLNQKDSLIDSELIFSFAKTSKLAELEEFLNTSNQADIGNVGDRCYNEKLYEAGRLLFLSINNWAKLASCLVKLKRFVEALDAAKKANTPKTWKEVNFACVVAKEFKLAAMAGLNIIIHPDHLEELIQHYEKYGCTDELISLIESGIAHERSHIGIFTELGILYAKYKGDKLMDHCRNYFARLNIPKLLRACERYKMWSEAVFLYVKYDEFDNAIMTMIEHSPVAWSHEIFTQVIQKATNQDLFYKSGIFYLEEQPMQVNELLKTISSKVDHAKMVQVIRKTGNLALILPWMQSVQMYNVAAVNDAVNELLLELEDFESLRQSVTDFENFDQIALAQKIERHSLMEMRRIAAFLYRRNQRYAQSLALSKQDEIYKDAMETARDSQTPELAEELMAYFITIRDKEAFCACSFVCYELLKPDVVMESAWRAGYFDFAMPFFIQTMREMTLRLNALEKKTELKEKKEEEQAEAQAHAPLETMDAISMMMPQLNSLPALGPSIPNMGGMPGMMTGMMPGVPGMYPTGYVDPMTLMSQQFQFQSHF